LTVLLFLDMLILKSPSASLQKKEGVFLLKFQRGSPMDQYNHLEIRCPRLGHELNFSYCRREAGDLPCQRTIKCWQAFFPVEAHLRESLSAAEWGRFLRQSPGDKMTTIIDLIEQAKARVKSKAE
jgi:hypothetical protein